MAYNPNTLTTGFLGFNLKKEFLNDGLFYRETESYNYEVYALPSVNSPTGYTQIEALIKAAFAGYSGNLTIKNLSESADFQFPDDHIRVGKFQVGIEIRKPILNLSTYQPEILGSYYKGLDENFWGTYGKYFNDFKEDFGAEMGENGNDLYSHSISFSLSSGDKSTATSIASNIFAADKDTTFGVSYLTGTGALIANTGNFRNYFSETYDLTRNTYSFTKKREVLPVYDTTYNYNLGHTLNLKEDGTIDVSEKGTVQSRLLFSEAQLGYSNLLVGSFNRCNTMYSTYKNFASSQTITESLANLPLNSSRTLNKNSLTIDYEILFTNNSNLNSQSGLVLDETIELGKSENNTISINHNYSFNLITSPIPSNIDSTYGSVLLNAYNSSPTRVNNYYQASSLFDVQKAINKIHQNASAGNRKKNLSISFEYSNNPVYFVTLDGVQYTVLDWQLNDAKPADIINEYKVINRPTKTSVLNYAYQTEKGTKNISVTARIGRAAENMFITPRTSISANINSLYKYVVSKGLESLKGTTVLSLSYYLAGVTYKVTHDNLITVDVSIVYTMKKYKDI